MSLERTKSNEFTVYPASGPHVFTIDKVEKRKSDKGKIYFLFKMTFENNGQIKKYTEVLSPGFMDEMLRGIGAYYDPTDKTWVWDRIKCQGQQIQANISIDNYNGKERNKLSSVKMWPMDQPAEQPDLEIVSEEEESVPF